LDDWAIQWLYGKCHEADSIRGPEGVGQSLHDCHLKTKLNEWKHGMQDRLVAKVPGFNWEIMTGPDPTGTKTVEAKHVRHTTLALNANNILYFPENIYQDHLSLESALRQD